MAANESGLVRRTIWVLRAVAAHPNGVGLSEIARESGIPKATCYRVLSVLERESWLTLDPDTRRYKVSLGLLSIVGGFLDSNGGYRHMRQVLSDLAADTQETCGFDVLHPPNVMVVAQAAGPRLIGQTMKPVPRTQPVWSTSTGKVLLAMLDKAKLDEYVDDIERHGPESLGGGEAFVAMLQAIRERGYAHSRDELEEGATSVAAPVRVGDSYPYAVWIGGPSFRLTPEWVAEVSPRLLEASRKLGELLTYTDLQLPTDLRV
ncbi:IclR family transcriptional regulator [Nocardioides carbamazepini]|uniref:IclR family transcriptional regulator n=1 Tax=Nocardioides carbamazepini TaxID=2854259 RepID=UPI00214A5E50|nr:IclR family transcriptional regulator [Nocardioides carbamazepini]MCR1784074.1 IclR family transcriptional regulator [Nocardioides carbamazepini]